MTAIPLVFFGTAELAVVSLDALAAAPWAKLMGVVTQPDRPRGRDLQLQPTPVKARALQLGLPVWQPRRCRDESFHDQLLPLTPELIVVVAYGQIIPAALLDLPRHGCLNVHASLLPRHRGAAPIQWAILEGDAETGVTIMRMDAGLDTGPMLTTVRTPIQPEDNAATLHDRLARLGAELLVRTIPDHLAGRVTPQIQPAEGATYARKITKEDGRLDWSRPAHALWNQVRAFTPWPGAFTFAGESGTPRRLLKLWTVEPLESPSGAAGEILEASRNALVVACGAGSLRILELQREGGRRLSVSDFLGGFSLQVGQVLG